MQTAGGAKRTPQETYLRIALRSGRAPRRIQRMGRPRKLDQHETGEPWPTALVEGLVSLVPKKATTGKKKAIDKGDNEVLMGESPMVAESVLTDGSSGTLGTTCSPLLCTLAPPTPASAIAPMPNRISALKSGSSPDFGGA